MHSKPSKLSCYLHQDVNNFASQCERLAFVYMAHVRFLIGRDNEQQQNGLFYIFFVLVKTEDRFLTVHYQL